MKLVFFVDDDILTLNKLRSVINWEHYGYTICGQAMDGMTAMSQIVDLKPDLVFLDMDIPKIDGVEVMEMISKHCPAVQVIILSNHDDFKYVRPAMRSGAYDYILKHQFSPDILIQKLNEVDKHNSQRDLHDSKESYFARIAKQQYLKHLLTGEKIAETEHRLMKTQPEYSGNRIVLSVMQIVNFVLLTYFDKENGKKQMVDSILNLGENIFTSVHNGMMIHIEHGRFAILFTFLEQVSEREILDAVHQNMMILTNKIHKFMNINVLWEKGSVVHGVDQLQKNYHSIVTKVEGRPLNSGSNIPSIKTQFSLSLGDEKELSNALDAFDSSRTKTILSRIFGHLDINLHSNECQGLIQQLLQIGARFINSYRLRVDDSFESDLQRRFCMVTELREYHPLLLEYYEYLINLALQFSITKYSPVVQKALSYIYANYSKDISLAQTAEHAGVSKAHLSRQFSKETSQGFTEFLTSYRIHVAQILLKKPGIKIKDISVQVGFRNYNYFLRVFKERTGSTVSKFK